MRISDWSSDVCSSDLNARALHSRDRGPYFYLPKLEAMEEAALWDAVMAAAEDELQLPVGTMKATVLIRSEERRVGKSGSVRVDLGGRRIIKKKKRRNYAIK